MEVGAIRQSIMHLWKLYANQASRAAKAKIIDAVAMMNVIYEKVWNPLHNHYIPQEKTLNKVGLGSKYKRTFRKPMTPNDVLVDLTNLPESTKGKLME